MNDLAPEIMIFHEFRQKIIIENAYEWGKNSFKKTIIPYECLQKINSFGTQAKTIRKKFDSIIKDASGYDWKIYFTDSKRYAEYQEIVPYKDVQSDYIDSSLPFTLESCKKYIKLNTQLGLNIKMEIHAFDMNGMVPWFIIDYHTIKSVCYV